MLALNRASDEVVLLRRSLRQVRRTTLHLHTFTQPSTTGIVENDGSPADWC
jgi:hypothetical protein